MVDSVLDNTDWVTEPKGQYFYDLVVPFPQIEPDCRQQGVVVVPDATL